MNGGASGPAVVPDTGKIDNQPPNSFKTLFEACAASASDVVDSDCRVCKARRLAPSSLVSASTRLSAPVLNVLITALVKSCRAWTTERLDPNVDACERKVLSAVVSLPILSLMSLSVWKLFVDADTPRPVELKVTPEIDKEEV